jgi:hypothetical protein
MAVLLLVLLVNGLGRLTSSEPSYVARLTVVNDTQYNVNVEVTGGAHDGWLDLGSVSRERTRTLEQIVDQGERWVFRFSYAGVAAGEVALDRTELSRQGWRLTVPVEVGERLREAGLRPSAP